MYHTTPNSQPTPIPTPGLIPTTTRQPITAPTPQVITNLRAGRNNSNFTEKLTSAVLDKCAVCIGIKGCNTEACKDCSLCAYCSENPTAEICSPQFEIPVVKGSLNLAASGAWWNQGPGRYIVDEGCDYMCVKRPQRWPGPCAVEMRDENGDCQYSDPQGNDWPDELWNLNNWPWVCQLTTRGTADTSRWWSISDCSQSTDRIGLVVYVTGVAPNEQYNFQDEVIGKCSDCDSSFERGYCYSPTIPPPSWCWYPCNTDWPTQCPPNTETTQWITTDLGTNQCGCQRVTCSCFGSGCGDCQEGQGPPQLTGITPVHGPRYTSTPITITGTNLTGTTRVKIGGYDATNVVVVSDTTVTANTPTLNPAGNVYVSIVSPTGETNAVTFRYLFPPPNITQVEPNEGPTTGYTVVTIKGTNLWDGSVPYGIDGVNTATITIGGVPVYAPIGELGIGKAFSYSELDGVQSLSVWSPAGSVGLKNITVTTDLRSDGTTTALGTTTLPDAYNYIQSLCSNGVKSWPGTVYNTPENAKFGVVMVSTAQSIGSSTQGNRAHVLALKNDGTVVGWGRNITYGECLGTRRDGTAITDESTNGQYVQILGQQLTGVVSVLAIMATSLALKADGTVVAWGSNFNGECLGTRRDGTAITSTTGTGQPVQIMGELLTGVTAIAGGTGFVIALKNGAVLGWGRNDNHQIAIPGTAKSGVTAIAACSTHCLALKDNGEVVAWGNFDGEYETSVPPSARSGVIAIAAGEFRSVALKDNGTVIVWGSTGEGLGTDINGNLIVEEFMPGDDLNNHNKLGLPVQIMGELLTGVTAISANKWQTMVIKNGGILAWGTNISLFGRPIPGTAQSSVPLEAASGVSAIASSEGDVRFVYLDANVTCPPPPECLPPFVLQQNGTDPSCGCAIWQCVWDGISVCPNGQHFVVIGTDEQGQDIVQCQNDCGICTPPPVCTGPDSILVPIRTDECGCITYECVDGFAFEGNADIKTNTIAPASGKEIVFNSQVLGKDATSPFNFVTKRQVPGIGSGFASQQYTDTADALNNKKINTYIKDQDTSWLSAAKTYADTADINQNNSLPDYGELERQIRTSLYFTRKWNKNNTEKSTTDGSSLEEMATTSYENTELQRLAAEQNGIYKNISEREMQVNVALKGTSINTVSSTTVTESFSNTEMFRNQSVNSSGELNIPIGVTSSGGVDNPINPFWSTISAGENNQAAVKNGTVYVWGRSQDSQRVGAGMTGVVSVHSGSRMTMVLKDNGTLVGWGNNNTLCLGTTASGALINNPTIASGKQTVKILGVELADVAQVVVGGAHAAALKTDGTVVAWGSNSWGQTTIPLDASQNVSAIASTDYFTLALKPDGTVIGWGMNTNGQCLGSTTNGTAITSSATGTPVKILGLGLTGVSGIAAGVAHSLALKDNGTVIGWGANSAGQCLGTTAGGAAIRTGNGLVTGQPVKINGYGLTGVSTIACGNYHTLALKNGEVVAWGLTADGQCTVPDNAKYNVTHIAAGQYTSMARKLDGTVVSWGRNDYDQTSSDIDLVNEVTTPSNPKWSAIAAGYQWNAVLKGGRVYAWGTDVINSTSTKIVRFIPTLAKSGVVAISGVWYHILALKDNGTVVGWGQNAFGECLGTTAGGTAILSTPTAAGETVRLNGIELTGVTAIAAGNSNTSLALKADGTVVAWGRNDTAYYQTTVPASAQSNSIFVAVGHDSSFAVKDNGTVVAWGSNYYGQCRGTTAGGAPITSQSATGQTVLYNGTELTGVTAIAAGNNHCLALKTDGTVVGWGYNYYGECLGTTANGAPINTPFLTSPVKIRGVGLTGVVKISCGAGTCMAVKSDGTVAVWGSTGSGYVGGQLPVSMNSNIVDIKPSNYSNEQVLLLKSKSNTTTTTTGEVEQYSACVMVGSTLRTIAQDFDSKGYTSSGTYDINSYMKSAGSLPATNNETDTINLKTIVPKDSWYRVIQKYPSNGTVVSWNEYTEQKQIIE